MRPEVFAKALLVLLTTVAVEIPSARAQDDPNVLVLKCTYPPSVDGPENSETFTIDFQQGSVTIDYGDGNIGTFIDGQPGSGGMILQLTATAAMIDIKITDPPSDPGDPDGINNQDDQINRETGQLIGLTKPLSLPGGEIVQYTPTAECVKTKQQAQF